MVCIIRQILYLLYVSTTLSFLLLALPLKTLPNGEYSNFLFLITSGLYPQSSPVIHIMQIF